MESFAQVYDRLNTEQKHAVDTIEGPVLVVAGPGTGKTQLLSARVAHILQQTDTLPQNILCLTFTESGASNMRDRLTRFIGRAAYDVQIGTYHAFGGDLIRRYPEYFTETRLERPVDELGKRQILEHIVGELSYRSPLKQTRHHLGDLMATISEVKRGLLTPTALRNIAASNLAIIETSSPVIQSSLGGLARMPSKFATAEPLFTAIHLELERLAATATTPAPFQSLAQLASEQLAAALAEAASAQKTKPLTAWKNDWLVKNADNQFVLAGALEAARIAELASVLEAYETALNGQGLYDFDDMILRAITALEQNDDLRYTLQERYQYLLLDEFQDTNAAQLRLVQLLCDNPVNEGRPNVLAVGDDDQAIYAFQGAQYSNMLDFYQMFRDVTVVNLSQNYRSTPEVLQTARNVAAQITDTLSGQLSGLRKTLTASNTSLPPTALQHTEYTSDVAELAGVAAQIRQLVASGVAPSDIAVLAPKHRYLEPLVPHLDGIPLRYERRENILEAPVVRQLLTMSRLVLALHDGQLTLADSLWPEVLSYPFWGYNVGDIWRLSWQCADQRGEGRKSWSELLLESDTFREAALLFLTLARQTETETLENILDKLVGSLDVVTGDPSAPAVRSSLRASLEQDEHQLYQVTTELTVLRARLREHEQQRGTALFLRDLLSFVAQYQAADEQLLNTSPYAEAASAVQLMTVFKAKGLEFAHVFLLCCQDDVWGSTSRGNSNKLTLPANLAPIRHAGTTEDERLRIFFVALTRAKHGLYLSSHVSTFAGKRPPRLKYLAIAENGDGVAVSDTLPASHHTIIQDSTTALPLATLETSWHARHSSLTPDLRSLLADRLQTYYLSPTDLTTFIDLEYAGPQSFLLSKLLRFPTAASVDVAFGNAMHQTLEWAQLELNRHGTLPSVKSANAYLTGRLERQALTPEQLALQQARGEHALATCLGSSGLRFAAGNRPEYSFRDEGVVYDPVRMTGKIDLLEIDQATKTITVIDYKTGHLGSDPAKRHRYELQLYCYKLLLQGSHTFRDYTVEQGKLVFIEPDGDGTLRTHTVTFNDAELARVQALVTAMWHCVQTLSLPDASSYAATLAGIKQFEAELLNNTNG